MVADKIGLVTEPLAEERRSGPGLSVRCKTSATACRSRASASVSASSVAVGSGRRRSRSPSPHAKNASSSNSAAGKPVTMKHRAKHSLLQRGRRNIIWNTTLALTTVLLACYFAYAYAKHLKQLHENELWFSRITEMEREISFRSEAGLYYSYYKQLVRAPSLVGGVIDLLSDESTESNNVINIVQRFNIFQEIFLAAVYRGFSLNQFMEPVYFYLNSVFFLQGTLALSVFGTAWFLSGSSLGGIMSFLFLFTNRIDATRADFAAPLRESFALPFVALENLICTVCLYQGLSKRKQVMGLIGVAVSSFCTAATWQFAQYIFLMQDAVLFSLCVVGASLPREKTWKLMAAHSSALTVVCVLQFFNASLMSSPAICLTVVASTVFNLQLDTKWLKGSQKFLKSVFFVCSVFVLTLLLHFCLKALFTHSDDAHIFRYLLSKTGLVSQTSREFDSLLYLCQGAFQSLPMAILLRLTESSLLPTYLLVLLLMLGVMVWQQVVGLLPLHYRGRLQRQVFSIGSKCKSAGGSPRKNHTRNTSPPPSPSSITPPSSPSSPSPSPSPSPSLSPVPSPTPDPPLLYNVLLSVLLGVLALMTSRFRCLWVPAMCCVAAAILCSVGLWRKVLEKIRLPRKLIRLVRMTLLCLFIGALAARKLPGVWKELEELREFYDPDTVDLMQWIKTNTPPDSVIAGSMQLMAGVKLCTGRRITNHPHFENKALRDRTLEIYQIYGKRAPEDVYTILQSHGTDYIIVEESICFAPKQEEASLGDYNSENCRLVDILDLVNDRGTSTLSSHKAGNHESGHGNYHPTRFCEALRGPNTSKAYSKHFGLVFENSTFRMYRLKKSRL